MTKKRYRIEKTELTWFEKNIKCQNACPASTNVPGYISMISQGKFDEAYALNKEVNLLPSVLGRVCTHPCESQCRRGAIDEPVAICALKRFCADNRTNIPIKEGSPGHTKGEKVAVIGSGPVGLTVAYDLAVSGYGVTLFESRPVAGGMLYLGIPEYRLPRVQIEREIASIRDVGVEIKTNVKIGEDLTIYDLFDEGYKAIFVGVGAHSGIKLDISGEDENPYVIDCIEFLRTVNLGDMRRPGKRVVIIGGGNSAIDAARTALRLSGEDLEVLDDDKIEATDTARIAIRLGAEDVTILYRRTREEMPASEWEIIEAEEEGVKMIYQSAPKKIIGEKGRITGLECIRMKPGEPDGSGRSRPIPVEGSEFFIETDVIITAIGQSPDLSFLPEDLGLAVSRQGTIMVNEQTLATNIPGIFAAGDAVTGPKTVIEGIAAGHRAAISIDEYIQGKKRTEKPIKMSVASSHDRYEDYDRVQRQTVPTLPLENRIKGLDEVERGYDPERAVKEASRCLKCNLNIFIDGEKCVLCGGCAEVCPYDCLKMVSLERTEGSAVSQWLEGRSPSKGTAMIHDGERCIRCGLCVDRCPARAISMFSVEMHESEINER